MADFSNLSTGGTKLKTTDIPILHIEGMSPVLTCKPANEDNAPYFNALLKRQRMRSRRKMMSVDTKRVKRNRVEDITLLAEHCVIDWKGVIDLSKKEVPFDVETCKQFFTALIKAPNGRAIFDDFRDEVSDPDTFWQSDDNDGDGVDGTAKN